MMTPKTAAVPSLDDNQLVTKQTNPLVRIVKEQLAGIHKAIKSSDFFRGIFIKSLISIMLIIAALIYMVYWLPKASEVTNNVVSLQVLLQDYTAQSKQVYQTGDAKALLELTQTQQDIKEKAEKLATDLKKDSLARIDKMATDVTYIQNNREALQTMSKATQAVNEYLPVIGDAFQGLGDSAAISQKQLLTRQLYLLEKIMRNTAAINAGSTDAFSAANALTSAKIEFEDNLQAQLNAGGGSAEDQKLIQEQADLYATKVEPQLKPILDVASRVDNIRTKVNSAAESNVILRKDLRTVNLKNSVGLRQVGPLVVIVLGLLGLVLAYLQYSQYKQLQAQDQNVLQAKRLEEESVERQRQIERNDSAVLRLMEELADLADGDLTINATVSEDSTGAIADSINYAIEQLRGLVMAINKTAIKVAMSSNAAQSGAMRLAQSSEHQAHEISGASSAINEMAVSIDDVSRNAMESAKVAEQSVVIAGNGAELVHRNIEGMDNIREQIQDTAKRIKRLGESSQEIGNIVSLINDITDQTNILALNAAIQASMAGEAGRGFAVVADEVQRLAERSAFATKEIEGLVKTIQADTSEAVISMEQTTSEVVRGAKMAKDGGKALEEIQSVSKHLSDLIQNISNAARQQAVSAGHIANTMTVIQEITSQNTAGTMETAKSIGELSEMAIDLNRSVEGFTLPEQSA